MSRREHWLKRAVARFEESQDLSRSEMSRRIREGWMYRCLLRAESGMDSLNHLRYVEPMELPADPAVEPRS